MAQTATAREKTTAMRVSSRSDHLDSSPHEGQWCRSEGKAASERAVQRAAVLFLQLGNSIAVPLRRLPCVLFSHPSLSPSPSLDRFFSSRIILPLVLFRHCLPTVGSFLYLKVCFCPIAFIALFCWCRVREGRNNERILVRAINNSLGHVVHQIY